MPIKVTAGKSAFPRHINDAEFLVSVQRSSPCSNPEDAVREFCEAMLRGELPQVQVVRFGDGFRWTYDVEVTEDGQAS